MSKHALVRMANQIAANFGSLSNEDAAAETAEHIRRFWEPRMRQELLALINEDHAAALTPVARDAAKRLG